MKKITKAEIIGVTENGHIFSLVLTDSGVWEAEISVIMPDDTTIQYFYTSPTLEGLQAFIDGVEHTTQTIEQETIEEQPKDIPPFGSPLSPHYIRG